MLFLDIESSLGVTHRLHLTIMFFSFSLTNLKQWEYVHLINVESISAVIKHRAPATVNRHTTLPADFFSGARMSRSVGKFVKHLIPLNFVLKCDTEIVKSNNIKKCISNPLYYCVTAKRNIL